MIQFTSIIAQLSPIYLSVEFAVLFILVPVFLTIYKSRISPIVPLMIVGIIVIIVLLNDPAFDQSRLTNLGGLIQSLPSILGIWIVMTIAMIGLIWWYTPTQLFIFPRTKPKFWMIVICFYPIFSVLPQTIIYRAFFLHRYEALFGSGWTMLVIAAIAFGLAHLVFRHALPIILTTIAGFLFVWRYASTGSALASAVEHALYGDMVFTVGLGSYFFLGSQRLVAQVMGLEEAENDKPGMN